MSPPKDMPRALIRPARRWSLMWLLPLAAIMIVVWLGWRAWNQRGIDISIEFTHGHGLKVGDDVRYRGIVVGTVRDLTLAPDAESTSASGADSDDRMLIARVTLHPEAANLARTGTRFWIVRPQLGWEGAAGLETLIGPRYIEALLGDGEMPRRRFVGVEAPPLVEQRRPGDLEVMLDAPQRGTLAPGAPVLYRQVRIGTVLSVGLASDGGGVEARLHIRERYAGLVHTTTQFWDAGGYSAQLGWRGLSVEIESLRALVSGGVALATPPSENSAIVRTGHRFVLSPAPPENWLEWQPAVSIGSVGPSSRGPLPEPLRARIGWEQSRFLVMTGQRVRHGWVVLLDEGLLGPEDLLVPGKRAREETVALEVAGRSIPLVAEPTWRGAGLAMIDLATDPDRGQKSRLDARPWRVADCRTPTAPEDCVIVADPSQAPVPVAAARLEAQRDRWRIDPAMPVDANWHGAAVVARADGRLVGLLIVDPDGNWVAPLSTIPN